MLAELSRREKEANIKPDSDIDIFLKVRKVDSQRPGFTLMVKKKKKKGLKELHVNFLSLSNVPLAHY